MSVIVEPSEELLFHSPFTRISKESLYVKNSGEKPIIFKVKTTAPKQYCVRPNAGKIEPNSEIEVQIILQPFKEEPAEDYKCKDKFLVQTAPLDETLEKQDVTSLWSHIEASDRQSMRQHKIKCVFVGPKDESYEPVEQEEPFEQPVPTEPVKEQVTAKDTERQVPIHNDVIPPPNLPKVPQPAPVDDTPIIKQEAQAPPVVAEKDEEHKQLKESLEKIKRLETELEELKKQREISRKESNVVGGRKLSPTVQPLDAVHQHLAQLEKPRAVEGYPPQVLLGVSILVFIFTYLFF